MTNFPTRIGNSSASAIDNIFIDISRLKDFSIIPFPNDLSDHDAQILTINIPVQMQSHRSKFTREINTILGALPIYDLQRFIPICDLPLATPHTASDVPPVTP
jgi:hypothetical protein